MTKDAVSRICDEIAPQYGYDPKLILAICEQESNYNPTARRLENKFFSRYVEKENYNEIDEILLSASYGLMQVMGLSLLEMEYIMSTDDIHGRLYDFLMIPQTQIKYGCQWLNVKKKLCKDHNDEVELLQKWNGGGNPNYAKEVLARLT